jgi:Synergist-CTERM protein sorting domain-containing protein
MYDVCISPWFYEGPACDPDWTCEVACRDDLPCAEGEICTELGVCLPWTEPEPEDEDDGDGCAAVPISAWGLMAVLPLVWRRRRR